MLRNLALGASLIALGGTWLLAQEGEEHRHDDEIVQPPPGVFQSGSPDPQAEMLELFKSVEKRMRQIDELLSDASAGKTQSLAQLGDSGMSKLLERSRENSVRTVAEIDRILELISMQPNPP